jgi:hypothetical protein
MPSAVRRGSAVEAADRSRRRQTSVGHLADSPKSRRSATNRSKPQQPARPLQAGGRRFDPGWLHSQTSCKQERLPAAVGRERLARGRVDVVEAELAAKHPKRHSCPARPSSGRPARLACAPSARHCESCRAGLGCRTYHATVPAAWTATRVLLRCRVSRGSRVAVESTIRRRPCRQRQSVRCRRRAVGGVGEAIDERAPRGVARGWSGRQTCVRECDSVCHRGGHRHG